MDAPNDEIYLFIIKSRKNSHEERILHNPICHFQAIGDPMSDILIPGLAKNISAKHQPRFDLAVFKKFGQFNSRDIFLDSDGESKW